MSYILLSPQEEELKKKEDLEMGGWVAKSAENGEEEKSGSITKAPALQRY